jgi:hypothetical protein
MQSAYYPGFTVGGGIGEAGGLIVTFILLVLARANSALSWLTLVALVGLLGMQVVFWLVTQPVNRFRLQGQKVGGSSAKFFLAGTKGSRGQSEVLQLDWTYVRDRWEYSHVARAALATLSLVAIVVGLAAR